MKKSHLLTAAACLLSVIGMPRITHADIMTTITFDEAGVPTGTLTNSSDFDLAGYHFNFTTTEDASISGVGVGGTNAIQTQQDNELIFTITRLDGGTFTLDGFDLNQTVSSSASLGVFGPGVSGFFNSSTSGYVTVHPAEFASTLVTFVRFDLAPNSSTDSIAIDNIQLTSSIPEPASLVLLGIGLLALTPWLRHRQA
jgi:hypothetical protein